MKIHAAQVSIDEKSKYYIASISTKDAQTMTKAVIGGTFSLQILEEEYEFIIDNISISRDLTTKVGTIHGISKLSVLESTLWGGRSSIKSALALCTSLIPTLSWEVGLDFAYQ